MAREQKPRDRRIQKTQKLLHEALGSLIREKDRWRVVVNVELLQRSVAVEVDRETLTPAHDLQQLH